jgi:hypothetical protein
LGITAGVLCIGGLGSALWASLSFNYKTDAWEKLQTDINSCKESIDDLTKINKSLTGLDEVYKQLNMFWGGLKNDVQEVKDVDDIIAMQIAEADLVDLANIEGSIAATIEMTDACDAYLEVLNAQGIQVDV